MSISDGFKEVICIVDLYSTKSVITSEKTKMKLCNVGGVYRARRFPIGDRKTQEQYYRIEGHGAFCVVGIKMFEKHFRRLDV